MTPQERIALLYKVAHLYYEKRMRKYKIGELLEQSPTQIANLLDEAKARDIVTITVHLPRLMVLQEHLKKKFKIRDAIVIPHDRDCPTLLTLLAKAAADYFEAHVKDGNRVALGGGYLMYRMVNMLDERPRHIEIYPAAIIARGPTTAHIDPLVVINSLWARSGQPQEKLHYVTVTPSDKLRTLKAVREHYRELLNNSVVAGLFNQMKQADWVFASIGSLRSDAAYIQATNNSTRNLLDEIKLDAGALAKQGVVGDVVYSFFDASGRSKPEWEVVATLGAAHLRRMAADENKNVVLVVGGYKIDALRAVLRGELCSVLITDARAAELLLGQSRVASPSRKRTRARY